MQTAGLLYGPEFHHLDHLAPLCALLEIPLIVTDGGIYQQAREFYPDLSLLHWNPHEAPEKLVAEFDRVICSFPRAMFDEIFYFAQALNNKRIRTIWCPHGNSDKGRDSPFMEGLAEEELILTYGERIEGFLKEKGIEVPTRRVGNYRLAYYKKHQTFYDAMLPEKKKPTILYAPTWQDGENNSSFPLIGKLLGECPEEFSLIVKLHPHLYTQFPSEVDQLRGIVTFIEDFPPIYPILAKTDLYIGDKSSIGYDFLFFRRPMIHLSQAHLPGTFLPKEKQGSLFEVCRGLLGSPLSTETLYNETFADVKRLDILTEESFL